MQDAPFNADFLWFLVISLQLLLTADMAYFVKDWNNCRGCRIEYECAKEYGIAFIEEES